MALDKLDRKILALYQGDTRRIAQSIGAEAGLSAAAVQRRLKRMREEGVITAEIAQLDPARLGFGITCLVTVSMAANSPTIGAPHVELERFKRALRAAREVQQCYHVTGAMDFVVIVLSPSMEAYADFAQRWFESNPAIARYDTHVTLDRVKVGLSVPVGV